MHLGRKHRNIGKERGSTQSSQWPKLCGYLSGSVNLGARATCWNSYARGIYNWEWTKFNHKIGRRRGLGNENRGFINMKDSTNNESLLESAIDNIRYVHHKSLMRKAVQLECHWILIGVPFDKQAAKRGNTPLGNCNIKFSWTHPLTGNRISGPQSTGNFA